MLIDFESLLTWLADNRVDSVILCHLHLDTYDVHHFVINYHQVVSAQVSAHAIDWDLGVESPRVFSPAECSFRNFKSMLCRDRVSRRRPLHWFFHWFFRFLFSRGKRNFKTRTSSVAELLALVVPFGDAELKASVFDQMSWVCSILNELCDGFQISKGLV